MKILRWLLAGGYCVFVVLYAGAAWAAEAPKAGFDFTSLWQLLIPVVVPLLIVGLKYAINSLPGWLIPIIAPVLGGIADAAIACATGAAANPVLGAVLGSAGVGIREVVDQIKKAAK